MRATSSAYSILVCLLFTGGLTAQDAPPPDEPTLKPDAPSVEDDQDGKVKLADGKEDGWLFKRGMEHFPHTFRPMPPEGGSSKIGPLDKDAIGAIEGTSSSAIPESIKKMSEEEKRKLSGLLQDASTCLGGVRVQDAFEKLLEAEEMAPDYAAVHNLLGAANTKVRNFERAAEEFEKSIKLVPESFMSRFNLTEIHFLQHKWPQAEKEFGGLIKSNPKMPERTKALIEFKILICMLKQDNEAGARAILKKFDFFDDNPAFYFSNAAIHFSKSEDADARSWMGSSERVFTPSQNKIYTHSFIEVGWIEKSLQ
ncbi:MAG: Tfp pilus assembly protein PilF [Hyphomicrobiaceae bacterium]|jgi:Tfp pilus assembly protein PilF